MDSDPNFLCLRANVSDERHIESQAHDENSQCFFRMTRDSELGAGEEPFLKLHKAPG